VFLEGAHKMLAERGFTDENPDKARIETEYEQCVQKLLAKGETQK